MKFTERQINKMASSISQAEEEKCKNAIGMVRDAMEELDYTDDGNEIRSYIAHAHSFSLDLRQRDSDNKIKLLVQGSYVNKTNISSESDVDVAVILKPATSTYRKGVMSEAHCFAARTFSATEFKDEVEEALKEHFGRKGVERHDKSIKVTGNTYRVDADVVPAYRCWCYCSNDRDNNPKNYIGGIEIRPDSGGSIINFPEQHIKSGIKKNGKTKCKFKKCVRIAKHMRKEMVKHRCGRYDKISSFGIESLLWNVDASAYTKYPSILDTFDKVLSFLLNNFSAFGGYKEANALKPLFPDQSSKRAYQEFVKEMYQFFEHD